jgi:hypothetical protein
MFEATMGLMWGWGRENNAHRATVRRVIVKRTLGRERRRWQDNFEIDLRNVGCEGGRWMELTQDNAQWRA